MVSRAAHIVNVSSSSGSLMLNADPTNPPLDVRHHPLPVDDGARRDSNDTGLLNSRFERVAANSFIQAAGHMCEYGT